MSQVEYWGSALIATAIIVSIAITLLNSDMLTNTKAAEKNKAVRIQNIQPPRIDAQFQSVTNGALIGENKSLIIPQSFEMRPIELDGSYNMPKTLQVKWGMIPLRTNRITFGFKLANPPITGIDTSPEKPDDMKVLQSDPKESGVCISFKNRGMYKIHLGKNIPSVQYTRDQSNYDPSSETMEIQFTQVGPRMHIDAIYNGRSSNLAKDVALNMSEIRQWPEKLMIMDKSQVQNVWLSYAQV